MSIPIGYDGVKFSIGQIGFIYDDMRSYIFSKQKPTLCVE